MAYLSLLTKPKFLIGEARIDVEARLENEDAPTFLVSWFLKYLEYAGCYYLYSAFIDALLEKFNCVVQCPTDEEGTSNIQCKVPLEKHVDEIAVIVGNIWKRAYGE